MWDYIVPWRLVVTRIGLESVDGDVGQRSHPRGILALMGAQLEKRLGAAIVKSLFHPLPDLHRTRRQRHRPLLDKRS
jgi:hypothetical protein